MESSFIAWLRSVSPAHPALEVGLGDDAASAWRRRRALGRDDRSADRRGRFPAWPSTIPGASDTKPWRSTSAIWPPWPRVRWPWSSRWLCPSTAVPSSLAICMPAFFPWPHATAWRSPAATPTLGPAAWRSASRRWALPRPRGPLLRSGARPGDRILVTGSFGGSILGQHLDFEPRVAEALLLADRYELHAGIDVSDGLSLDLSRLAGRKRLRRDCSICRKSRSPTAAVELAARAPTAARRLTTRWPTAKISSWSWQFLPRPPSESCAISRSTFPLPPSASLSPSQASGRQLADGGRLPLQPRGYEH